MLSLFARKIKDILTFFKTFYSNRFLAFDTGVPSSGDEKYKKSKLIFYIFFNIQKVYTETFEMKKFFQHYLKRTYNN